MADNDEVREVPVQGNEWEVVSLTASAYAASPGPGPGQAKLIDDDQGHCVDENKKSDPEAMYMSHHFVFPPSQHENSPLVPKKIETPNEQTEQVHKDSPDFVADEGGISNTKDGEYWDVKALSMADEFPGMHFVDEKAKNLSESGTELEGGIALHSLTLADEEQTIYSTDKFSSVHGQTTIGGYAPVEENRALAEPVDPSEGIYSAIIQSPEQMDQDKDDDSAAWWKRRASSLYAQAKEANAVWSIFIAASVMGLVIIGQRWQQERWQVLQHNGPNGDEKASKMLGPLSRLKYVIIGGQQSGSVIRGSSSSSTQR